VPTVNYPNDHVLLHHARHVVRDRRAYAERAAFVAAVRAERPRFVSLRAALADRLGRFARLLAAIAEDLDPASARTRRPVPMAPRRG
jgi:hypothetical protein